jgi:hypothetical protein
MYIIHVLNSFELVVMFGPFSNLTVNRFGGPSSSDSGVKGLGVINCESSNEFGVECGPFSSPSKESEEDSAAKANKFALRLSYSVFSSTVIFLVGLASSSCSLLLSSSEPFSSTTAGGGGGCFELWQRDRVATLDVDSLLDDVFGFAFLFGALLGAMIVNYALK